MNPTNKSVFLHDEQTTIEQEALAGNAEAQNILGLQYYLGMGVEKNLVEALNLFEQAAEQGNMFAIHIFDHFLYRGHDMNINTEMELANNGNPVAQKIIAQRYDNGREIEKNVVEAAKWYEKAALQGEENALLQIGRMYRDGRGVKKDLQKARHFLEEAAKQGNNLGTLTLKYLDNKPLSISNIGDKFTELFKSKKTKKPKP